MISVSNLSFNFVKEVSILKNISFEVRAGEFVGILGPNGSGKTTLLKILSGVLDFNGGDVFLKGEDIRKIKPKERAKFLAIVPQEFHPIFQIQVFEVVLSGRFPYLKRFAFEGEKDIEIAKKVMKSTDTFHLKDRYTNELSGGEKQRVMIAKALCQEPEILLLDEPTTFLDIKHQIEIYNLLKELNEKLHLTILAVLHDINMATFYCNRCIFIKNGAIYCQGDPQQVVTKENIEAIYETSVEIVPHPISGKPVVLPCLEDYSNSKNLFYLPLDM